MYFVIRIKNHLKKRLPPNSKCYALARWAYGKIFFPLQHSAWRRQDKPAAKPGPFNRRSELYMCSLFPKELLDFVIGTFRPASALDVGCGTGVSLEYFLQHGVDAVGLEGSDLAIKYSGVGQRIVKHDLSHPAELGRTFDFVWCHDVAEHIPEIAADTLVATICRHGRQVFFSAGIPGEAGQGHVNEQFPAYWIQKFKKLGFAPDPATDRVRHLKGAANALIFTRSTWALGQTPE
jgi:SAM-dependent methyltransferase